MSRTAVALTTSLALSAMLGGCSTSRELGFWFEPVTFQSRSTGVLTAADIDAAAAVARAEIVGAFARLQVTVSTRREAMYRVRVVQELRDLRSSRRLGGPAGESRAVAGLGGSGAVNFTLLASNAVGYAPPSASRAEIIAAIGRGVGRAAIHEFTHQLMPKAAIDAATNVRSYEYRFAGRPEQYWGDMEWDIAWPLLEKRLGLRTATLQTRN